MNIQLDEGAFMPEYAHPGFDAGFDIRSPIDFVVPARGSVVINTGIHIELAPNTVGMLKSKSGLNVNHDLTSEGVIDVNFCNSIRVKLYNHGNTDYHGKRGDKISQLVVMPFIVETFNLVEKLEEKGRGNNGFGSTGR